MIETFTREDAHSQTWHKVKAYAEAELKQHRVNLEVDQTPERTAKLRGAIRALVNLLDLANNTPAAIEDADD